MKKEIPIKNNSGAVTGLKDSPLFSAAAEVVCAIREKGHNAYFVGGAVRDMLMGIAPKDIDIATSATPAEVSALFPRNIQVGASFGIVKVIHGDFIIEVATFREEREYSDGRRPDNVTYTDNPRLDAARRDFTINSLYFDPLDRQIYDFFEGEKDIRRGLIRTVGDAETRFSEDYLRILRAVRFSCRFGFHLDEAIVAATKKLAPFLKKLSAERVRDELNMCFTGPDPRRALELMMELRIADIVLPEVAAMKGVEQHCEYHPEGDVMVHTLIMLGHLTLPDPELAWAVLLHDVAKPVSRSVGDDGISHFYRHENIGAEMAAGILGRLKFPASFTEKVSHIVANHMAFSNIDKMRTARWKRIMGAETFPSEMELHRIDCISSHGKLDNFHIMLDRIKELENTVKLPPPLITGTDLINLGFTPGPAFGKILAEIYDKQLEGIISDRNTALDHVKTQFIRGE